MNLDLILRKNFFLNNVNGTRDPAPPPSWQMPLKISLSFWRLPLVIRSRGVKRTMYSNVVLGTQVQHILTQCDSAIPNHSKTSTNTPVPVLFILIFISFTSWTIWLQLISVIYNLRSGSVVNLLVSSLVPSSMSSKLLLPLRVATFFTQWNLSVAKNYWQGGYVCIMIYNLGTEGFWWFLP